MKRLPPTVFLALAIDAALIFQACSTPKPPAAPAPAGPDWVEVIKAAGLAGLRMLVCPSPPAPEPVVEPVP